MFQKEENKNDNQEENLPNSKTGGKYQRLQWKEKTNWVEDCSGSNRMERSKEEKVDQQSTWQLHPLCQQISHNGPFASGGEAPPKSTLYKVSRENIITNEAGKVDNITILWRRMGPGRLKVI